MRSVAGLRNSLSAVIAAEPEGVRELPITLPNKEFIGGPRRFATAYTRPQRVTHTHTHARARARTRPHAHTHTCSFHFLAASSCSLLGPVPSSRPSQPPSRVTIAPCTFLTFTASYPSYSGSWSHSRQSAPRDVTSLTVLRTAFHPLPPLPPTRDWIA